jgi:sulfur-oxidizing protein SoxZ
MSQRALIHLPATVRRGEVILVRALVAHPMETGHRVDSGGQRLPRDIIRRVEARLDGELVFAADLHPAIAANPYLVFPLRVTGDGTLTVVWSGDRGLAHRGRVEIVATRRRRRSRCCSWRWSLRASRAAPASRT